MQRWKCPIYNITLENLIKTVEDNVVFRTQSVFVSVSFPKAFISKKYASHFVEKSEMKMNSLKMNKHECLIQTWSGKAFKGPVVNRALPSLDGGSLEITLTVPLIIIAINNNYIVY